MMMAVSDANVVEEDRTCTRHGPYKVKLFSIAGQAKYGSKTCPVCDASIAERSKKQDEQRLADQIESGRLRRHEQSRIPARFKNRRFDNYVVEHEGQAKALKICRMYADSWAKVSAAGTGLIFSGKAGAGKTHLACSIAFEVIEKGGRAKFATVAEVMRQIKGSFAKDSTTTEQQEIDYFSGIQLLILDEVGMDYGTDFNKALIFEILNNRYENVLPTILLTNLDTPALKDYLGERLVDRMREGGGRMVSFTWDSYRGKAAEAGE
jgi:DNA replication protein DnaC